jgi:hypothetical protein
LSNVVTSSSRRKKLMANVRPDVLSIPETTTPHFPSHSNIGANRCAKTYCIGPSSLLFNGFYRPKIRESPEWARPCLFRGVCIPFRNLSMYYVYVWRSPLLLMLQILVFQRLSRCMTPVRMYHRLWTTLRQIPGPTSYSH